MTRDMKAIIVGRRKTDGRKFSLGISPINGVRMVVSLPNCTTARFPLRQFAELHRDELNAGKEVFNPTINRTEPGDEYVWAIEDSTY